MNRYYIMVKKLHLFFFTMLGMMLSVGTKAYADYATVQAPYEVDFLTTQDQFVIEDVVNDLGTHRCGETKRHHHGD